MVPWREKANRIIYQLCERSYVQANTSKTGKRSRKHRPYAVPDEAQILVECLRDDNEEKAKALFIQWSYRSDMPL